LTEPATPAADPRPLAVTLAVLLLSVALAIGVLILVYAWGYPTIALGTFLLVGGLILAIAGRQNWARWALAGVTVAALAVSGSVVWFQLTYGVVLPLATGAQLALEGVAFYLLFRPSSGRWFRRRERWRDV
jgi:hypothetical protein